VTVSLTERSAVTMIGVGEMPLERFASVLDPGPLEELRAGILIGRTLLAGRTVWNVNSTARGGGVAEMLATLLAYARGIGVDTRWAVIEGNEHFFEITKRIHNRLHGYPGDGGPLGDAERKAYEDTLAPSAHAFAHLIRKDDVVILHDPQTAGLVPAIRALGVPVVWRCHVGIDSANRIAQDTWGFLASYVNQADATVFSRELFAWDVLDGSRHAVITPTIDAFASKNELLGEPTVNAILVAAGLRSPTAADGAPPAFTRMDGSIGQVDRRASVIEEQALRREDQYVLQVSRWDSLKDPMGVIQGFSDHIAPHHPAHLVYAGPAAADVADDPEATAVLNEVLSHLDELPPDVRARIHLAMLPLTDAEENAAMVNALQRGAAVVVQKSLAEGFGLTVAEAMWKGRPVVASRIGGIQDQIEDGVSGVLLDDPTDLAEYGAAVTMLLLDPAAAASMGAAAQERVRDQFLGPRSLLAYLYLLERLLV
jgi:trehalose synthase